MRLMMKALREDNDENAIICVRVSIELHKNYRTLTALEEYVQPFFDTVRDMLQNLPKNIVKYIDESKEETTPVCSLIFEMNLTLIFESTMQTWIITATVIRLERSLCPVWIVFGCLPSVQ